MTCTMSPGRWSQLGFKAKVLKVDFVARLGLVKLSNTAFEGVCEAHQRSSRALFGHLLTSQDWLSVGSLLWPRMPSPARVQPRLTSSQSDRFAELSPPYRRETPPPERGTSAKRESGTATAHDVARTPEGKLADMGAAEDAVFVARDARSAFLQVPSSHFLVGVTVDPSTDPRQERTQRRSEPSDCCHHPTSTHECTAAPHPYHST